MATNKEYEQWKKDPVSQQEYAKYLLEEAQKTDPKSIDFINQFTSKFNEIFKEKS
jgi:hypothetical protein